MASFQLTDGQLGDDTHVDGMIVDPGGPAVAAAVAPVLSAWGLIALIMMLGTVAWLGLQLRKGTNDGSPC
jgi:hypothetical protein